MTPIDNGTINYKDELIRKLIHLFSLSIPAVYYFTPRSTAIVILTCLTAAALLIDLGRYYLKDVGKIFYNIFGFMLREHEIDHRKKNLNGATYVLLSALICVIIFPKIFFITSFSILIISDSMAALIGRKFGKHKLFYKSWEGTLAFFFSASIVIFFTPKLQGSFTEYLIGIIASMIGAIVENISFGFADDNLSIPISISLTMWILYILLLPDVQLIIPNVPR